MSQGLVAAKSRLSKKGLSIPRLELVSGHMSANLLDNVKGVLQDSPVRNTYGWLDSTVALHWIRGKGEYRQFVHNRVRKIQERSDIQWRHVRTDHNPADLGSRGGKVNQTSELWWNGPSWLSHPQDWPQDITTSTSKETEEEAKIVREVLAVTVPQENDQLDEVIQKCEFRKVIRITAWITRFIRNAKVKHRGRIEGPLTTDEIEEATLVWVKRVQHRCENTKQFQKDRLKLNLQKDGRGVYECRGRLQGDYPIYLPDQTVFTEKLVMNAHSRTLLGGIGLTMTRTRGKYWVPHLRQLVRKVRRKCNGCKRFHATAFAKPPSGNLPIDRTVGSSAFQVIGVDYAGPIPYRVGKNRERKSYILLYACSLSRAQTT